MHRVGVLAVWDAAILLSWTGWGSRYWHDCPFHPRAVLATAMGIGIAGYFRFSPAIWPGFINCGWMGLAILIVAIAMAQGKLLWWARLAILGPLAYGARLAIPLFPIKAGVEFGFWPEAWGMAILAAVWSRSPFQAALVAIGAEILAALLMAMSPGVSSNLGNHDLDISMVAGLSAWMLGWVWVAVRSRLAQIPRGTA